MVCQDAGIQIPIPILPVQALGNIASGAGPLTPKAKMLYSENSFVVDEQLGEDELLCEICCDLIEGSPTYNLSCRHSFCNRCWKNYLYIQIQGGRADYVTCPSSECNIIVPMQIIEMHMSPRMARKYLKLDQNFFEEPVDTSLVRPCPYPDCQIIVKISEADKKLWKDTKVTPPLSHAVECGKCHFFCWECGLPEAHAPLACTYWQQWLTRCEEAVTSLLDHQWLITNSRGCPNCHLTLQKQDGSNHVKCTKCHYDFCWVCLGSWKKHSSSTGGAYFHCNRYEPVEGDMLNSFVHYYIRYKNHSNSRAMEKLLLKSAKKKRDLLRASLTTEIDRRWSTLDHQGLVLADTGTDQFFESGVWELLHSRTSLCGSYAYGFYLLEESSSGKTGGSDRMRSFEIVQHELEEITEHLSQMMARPYLRIPRKIIIQTIQLCKNKRQVCVHLINCYFLGTTKYLGVVQTPFKLKSSRYI